MSSRLHLFDAYGVELEYMIVHQETLDVRPIADALLRLPDGSYTSEMEHGEIAWSNELAAHVIELKTNGPAESMQSLATLFHEQVSRINSILSSENARLMPTAMHPWMDPDKEFQIWPHEHNEVYESYHRIFDCRGHGWSNLQSVHLNLPFADDDEFGRLHAAIRLILPLLPALAASSPILDGEFSRWLDTRMHFYALNSRKVGSLTGDIIPEAVFSKGEYERKILKKMYRDIRPLDPQGILQHEWLNARGAIARFDRSAIEIRILDIQECPQADVAICQLIAEVLRQLVENRYGALEEQQSIPTEALRELLDRTTETAEHTIVADPSILQQFGCGPESMSATELWKKLLEDVPTARLGTDARSILQDMLDRGSLATCITRDWKDAQAVQQDTTPRAGLQQIYRQLCDNLSNGCLYESVHAG